MLQKCTDAVEQKVDSFSVDIRESMRVFPEFIQPFLTWLTAKPYQCQKSWQRTPIYHLLRALIDLCLGISLSVIAVKNLRYQEVTNILNILWLFLLTIGWIFTVSGGRQFQVVISHHCSHNSFSIHKKVNKWLGEIISIILILKNFTVYQPDHVSNHHAKALMTLKDETLKFLFLLVGFRTGMTKKQLWNKLIFSLFSPWFHFRFLAARIKSCFFSPFWVHNTLTWSFWLIIITVVTITKSWTIFLVTWFFPLTILYQVSNTIRICSEHCFPEPEFAEVRNKLILGRLTKGIFLGEQTPDISLSFLPKLWQWLRWYLLMFYHLFCRIFILVGDTPCHDWHHRHPASPDWVNYIFARQQDLENGCPGWQENYTEIWGFYQAIDFNLESLSRLPKIEEINTNNAISSVYSLGTIESN
ncbi:fatty acid desaturase [Geminocystis sp. GBBB08]|uniref:fatty acid desaturase n=1 Tax=Geminocystis sp. GBBB08 TaxID=2604140 RepID=UPI0027E2B74D|nr:fatty acid desaturase [Geminocystis sp. GBBB08]MBL1210480.1 hypothetical protein [Geminocystis sp. GBBB08]